MRQLRDTRAPRLLSAPLPQQSETTPGGLTAANTRPPLMHNSATRQCGPEGTSTEHRVTVRQTVRPDIAVHSRSHAKYSRQTSTRLFDSHTNYYIVPLEF